VAGRERGAARGGARLVEHGRALRRGLALVRAPHREPLADVVELVHALGLGEHVGRGVAHDGVVIPAALPQCPGRGHVLVGAVVAPVVGQVLAQAVDLGRVQLGGDDVPPDPPAGEVASELNTRAHS